MCTTTETRICFNKHLKDLHKRILKQTSQDVVETYYLSVSEELVPFINFRCACKFLLRERKSAKKKETKLQAKKLAEKYNNDLFGQYLFPDTALITIS